MLGTIVNMFAIIVGSLLGIFFRGGIPKRYNDTVMQAVGLAVVLIGLRGALKTDELLLVILSLAAGSLIGEFLGIEDRLQRVGDRIGALMKGAGEGVAEGFVTASLVYCVGAMAIVGALESGLAGNHQTLYAKSLLDGITAVVFASTLGIGVIFSSISVLIYQGGITLAAAVLKQVLTPAAITQMSAVGGLLIMAIGLNLLEIRKLKIGNMLPAIFLPLLYYAARQALGLQ